MLCSGAACTTTPGKWHGLAVARCTGQLCGARESIDHVSSALLTTQSGCPRIFPYLYNDVFRGMLPGQNCMPVISVWLIVWGKLALVQSRTGKRRFWHHFRWGFWAFHPGALLHRLWLLWLCILWAIFLVPRKWKAAHASTLALWWLNFRPTRALKAWDFVGLH